MKSAFKNTLLATTVLLSTVGTLPTAAALVFNKPALTIEKLPAQSAIAENSCQDLLLRADGDGSMYLYVEQQQGALLAVFDVTDPEHMKLVASSPSAARGAYDFVGPVKDGELVSFRDGSGSAVLDLHKAKAPRLSVSSTLVADAVGATHRSLISYDAQGQGQIQIAPTVQPRSVQFVSRGRHARVLASLGNVTRMVERAETGTTFLLADGKVRIVRSHDAELQYEDQQVFPDDPV
jgi:hypothetical protein